MTLQRQSRIACDIPDCDAVSPWVAVDGMTPGAGRWAAWRAAHAAGWGNGDYGDHCCPAHAAGAQRVRRVAELAAQGLSDGEIGRRLYLSRGAVWYVRSRAGIPGQRPGRPSPLGAAS